MRKRNSQKSLAKIEMSTRLATCLKNEGFKTLGDVCKLSELELMRIPNFGRKSLNELKELLARYRLNLSKVDAGWVPHDWPRPGYSEKLGSPAPSIRRALGALFEQQGLSPVEATLLGLSPPSPPAALGIMAPPPALSSNERIMRALAEHRTLLVQILKLLKELAEPNLAPVQVPDTSV